MQTQLVLNNLRQVAKGLTDWADEIEKGGNDALMRSGKTGRAKSCELRDDLYAYENLICAVRKSI